MVFYALTFSGSGGNCLNTRPLGRVQISSEGSGKCYCNEIIMDDRYSCITYDSNGTL